MRQIFAFFLTTLLLCLGVNQVWAETESVAYVLTDKLENGGEYLIVNTNALGDAVAMTHEGATIQDDGVTISAGIASSGNQPYILEDRVGPASVWTAATRGDGFSLVNDGYYPSVTGNTFSLTQSPSTWTYDGTRLSTRYYYNYYLYYTGSAFSAARTTSSNVYIFKKTNIVLPPTIFANPSSVGITAVQKHTVSTSVYVTPINLTSDIQVSVTSGADMFSVDKTTISKDSKKAVGVLVSFKAPENVGTYSGILTLSSEGASPVTVNLTGVSEQRDENKVIYELTSTVTDGEKYLIVSSNTAGPGTALGHTADSYNNVDVNIVNDGEFSNTLYIDKQGSDITSTSEWTAGSSGNGRTFENGGYYVRHGGLGYLSIDTQVSTWTLSNNSLYFTGWLLVNYTGYLYYDSSWGIDINQQHSVYFYQKREIPVRIVDFNSNGGSDVQAQDVCDTKLATKPEDPTKEGYVFAGWYTDAELTTTYEFSTPVTQDITLYAKWETAWYDLTIGNARAATLYLDFAADIPTKPLTGTGALEKVYYITQVADYEANAVGLNGVIPALTGVVLEGDPGTYRFMRSADQSVSAPTDNMLDGSLETISDPRTNDKTKDDYGKSLFTLTTKTGKLQFMLYSGSTLAANRAFLIYREDQTAGSKMLSIVFNGGTTGISAAEAEKTDLDGEWYTLQGVRLNGKPTQRGIYICNGKRILVK